MVVHIARWVRRAAMVAGWLALAFVIFSTLSPIEFRPHVAGPNYERLAAFLLIGGLFGLAYPRRPVTVAICIIIFACGLELAQHLIPGRHGRMLDASVKCFGGLVGVFGAMILNQLAKKG